MTSELDKLKAIAIERYNLDGGWLYECNSEAELAAMIAEHGTAEAAWTEHMRILEAQKEAYGFYERF